jgi:hypothetical protein
MRVHGLYLGLAGWLAGWLGRAVVWCGAVRCVAVRCGAFCLVCWRNVGGVSVCAVMLLWISTAPGPNLGASFLVWFSR